MWKILRQLKLRVVLFYSAGLSYKVSQCNCCGFLFYQTCKFCGKYGDGGYAENCSIVTLEPTDNYGRTYKPWMYGAENARVAYFLENGE